MVSFNSGFQAPLHNILKVDVMSSIVIRMMGKGLMKMRLHRDGLLGLPHYLCRVQLVVKL